MSLEEQSSAELSKGLRLLKHTCLLADTLLSSLIDLVPSWISSYIRWCPTSSEHLEDAERKLLSYSILGCKGNHQISTLQLGPGTKEAVEEERVPLVLVHGFGAGVALWLLNLDYLAQDRTTYCFDLLGFGRSSRPRLSRDSLEAEYQFVQSIEEWRAQVGLDRFVLLGHSMGGFLAASYAIRFPERVAHLVLADPWGFPARNTPRPALQLPSWVRVVSTLLSPFNPLAAVRIAGPWGPRLVEKIRPDIGKKYGHVVDDNRAVPHYIYHCNAQTPSGESAFKAMMTQYGWARHPMISRIGELHQSVPMTFIYGSRCPLSKPGQQQRSIEENGAIVKEELLKLLPPQVTTTVSSLTTLIRDEVRHDILQEEPRRILFDLNSNCRNASYRLTPILCASPPCILLRLQLPVATDQLRVAQTTQLIRGHGKATCGAHPTGRHSASTVAKLDTCTECVHIDELVSVGFFQTCHALEMAKDPLKSKITCLAICFQLLVSSISLDHQSLLAIDHQALDD
ncbi:hypothetical protein HPB51_013541 [Rhipicephalus microplus]|uniref:AB hydrolase-1 domain-containing protein n=1 Tax=Rhipicephalus microplus TaxID=6941 RepID=A0A9J6D9J7_RHIMP|nr:hypothetical protein HPB51_013541 [Rhipicephalus microplus]